MSTQQDLFVRAQRCLVGGVNSPVRSFRAVGGSPVFVARGEGPYLFDVDNKRYLDYVCSWGAIALGHAHPGTIDVLHHALQQGFGFGAATEIELSLAEKIISVLPSIDCVRMTSSGTEAAMTALRLARGVTGRNKIIKFGGCYHGHADAVLVDAGSGALTCGVPSSAGIPTEVVQHTLVATFNDLDSVEQCFAAYPDDVAALIVEPVVGNMNLIAPQAGFLAGLRALCDQYGALLIFDEVMTGFRVGLQGAQGLYGITPDLTILGKVIGGGLPAAALGGRWAVMEHLAPLGSVYQAGTLSGNPIAMAAGLVALETVSRPGFYEHFTVQTTALTAGLHDIAQRLTVPLVAQAVGGMWGFVFSEEQHITCFDHVANSDVHRFRAFFHGMLARGVYLPPSPFEACFMTAAHHAQHIAATLNAVEDVLQEIVRDHV